jgi:hypothetical protein
LKIILVNKGDGVDLIEYESETKPSKGEIIISEIRGEAIEVKVDQVFHVIKDNRMANRNELKCVKVIVKPVVTSM